MTNQSNQFKLGISSWTFPWASGAATGPQPEKKLTPLQLLEIAKELSVPVVQIADNMPLEKLSEQELNEVRSFALKNNIAIEVGTKGVEPAHLSKMIEIALYLDAKILRTLPALFGKKIGMDEVEKNIREILPQIESKGITLVLENTEAFSVDEYADLMERINHPGFRMCVDAANAIGKFEGPHYVIDNLVKYCANFHFKDIDCIRSSTLMGFNMVGAVSGQGQIPLKYAITKLKERGIFCSIILEQWPPLLDNMEATLENEKKMAVESILYIKSALK